VPVKLRTLNTTKKFSIEGSFVRMEGLEPPRLAAPDPKSGAATNYATSGCAFAATIPMAIGNATSGYKPVLPVKGFGKKERKFRDYSELKNTFQLFK
jgi:hypothetical protein